jgi:hypothetical protein
LVAAVAVAVKKCVVEEKMTSRVWLFRLLAVVEDWEGCYYIDLHSTELLHV